MKEMCSRTELRVRRYIAEQDMIRPGDRVLVGLSGGADSVFLLLVLDRLRRELPFTLEAVHVNHGIRGEEALRDQNFAVELCRSRQIPCRVAEADVPALASETGMTWEEAGRRERYRIFREMDSGKEGRFRIAVAHHMDDQAETVLMNLCRGTGIRGIGAMAPVQGSVIRPLLELRKSEILEQLREKGQAWCEDSTNGDTGYTRNCLRREILPLLQDEINPRVVEHLAAAAGQAREVDRWLEEEAEAFLARFREPLDHFREEEAAEHSQEAGDPETDQGRKREVRIPVGTLRELPPPVRSRVLLRLTEEAVGSARNITGRHLEALDQLVTEDRGGHADLPRGASADRIGAFLRICPGPAGGEQPLGQVEREGRCLRSREGGVISPEEVKLAIRRLSRQELDAISRNSACEEGKIPEKRYTKWFDYDRIKGAVVVRTRMTGDEIALSGVGHKSLRRYMMDEHIPAEDRDRTALVADEKQVLWVIGHRINADCQVTEDTTQVLEITAVIDDERRLP